MTQNRFQLEVHRVIERLQKGGKLLVIEEKPYPSPHKVIVILGDEEITISYNDFAFLASHNVIQHKGTTVFGGFPAEEFVAAKSDI